MPTTTCAFAEPLSDRDFQRCSAAKDRLSGKVDVLLGRGPVGDRDPHRTAILPDRATHPTRPVALDRRDDRRSALVGPAVQRTASVYELGDARSTERA